jgi:hypothetical protein
VSLFCGKPRGRDEVEVGTKRPTLNEIQGVLKLSYFEFGA